MSQFIQAIYENGVLRPLEAVHLDEHQQVRVTIEKNSDDKIADPEIVLDDDPLQNFRVSLGIPDLSEKFNEYRFGKCKN
jgi:predicted DNA-binding antitoxin AbrB/MazE fold protein